jgi:hypothetical protein
MKTLLPKLFISILLIAGYSSADTFSDALNSAVDEAMVDPEILGSEETIDEKNEIAVKKHDESQNTTETAEKNCEESVKSEKSNNPETKDNDNKNPENAESTTKEDSPSSECNSKKEGNDENENEEKTPSEKNSAENKLDADQKETK